MNNKIFSRQSLLHENAILFYLASGYFLLHLFASVSGGYGYFRDELYYMVCAERLAFGYVDHPPLAPFLLRLVLMTLGDSIVAIRFLPALAGSGAMIFTGLIARRLGAGKFAQGIAAFAMALAPVFLVLCGFFSMNPFETLLWATTIYVIILLIQQDEPRLWLLVGVLVGLGLLNKHTLIVYIGGLGLGVLLTPARKYLASKWLWFGVLIAVGLLLPNIIWQILNGFPSLEFYHNATLFKNIATSPIQVILDQVLTMNPVTVPLWITGIWFYLFSQQGKPYRMFGWMYLVVLGLMLVAGSSRPDRLLAVYPLLFAGGAGIIEQMIQRFKRHVLIKSVVVMWLMLGIGFMPMGLPILPPTTLVEYSKMLGLTIQIEKHQTPKVPQWYADRFGWEELVETVAGAYNSLSPEEQAQTAIFVTNYGEAGAIDFFGEQYDLPNAIASHNNYWLWGSGEHTGDVVIILGGDKAKLEQVFEKVEQAAITQCDYCMPYEDNRPVYVCRGLRIPIQELWLAVKHYD